MVLDEQMRYRRHCCISWCSNFMHRWFSLVKASPNKAPGESRWIVTGGLFTFQKQLTPVYSGIVTVCKVPGMEGYLRLPWLVDHRQQFKEYGHACGLSVSNFTEYIFLWAIGRCRLSLGWGGVGNVHENMVVKQFNIRLANNILNFICIWHLVFV